MRVHDTRPNNLPAQLTTFVGREQVLADVRQVLGGAHPGGGARQLASRARRRVQGAAPAPDADLAGQRAVISAFLAAARGGDFDGLLAVLDPDVVLRSDRGAVPLGASRVVRGAAAVAAGAVTAARYTRSAQLALVNGAVGVVSWAPNGRPFAVMGFTVRGGKIVEIDALADPERLSQLDLVGLDD